MPFGEGFSLLCPAQGFPVPSFKYVQDPEYNLKFKTRSSRLKSSRFLIRVDDFFV